MINIIRLMDVRNPWKGVKNVYLDVFDEAIDVKEACREAMKEYLKTPEGEGYFCDNEWHVPWTDFDEVVPNEICEHHGFRKIKKITDVVISCYESMFDYCFHVSNIQWDVDGEDDLDGDWVDEHLPRNEDIFFTSLLKEDETSADCSLPELKERIADHLSDGYGFCVKSFDVDY